LQDILKITVFDEPELSAQSYRVDSDGMITFWWRDRWRRLLFRFGRRWWFGLATLGAPSDPGSEKAENKHQRDKVESHDIGFRGAETAIRQLRPVAHSRAAGLPFPGDL
jgi:hypothetical protein